MKFWLRKTIFVAGISALAFGTVAAPKPEVGLLGIKLYDTGIDVVKKFGSPNDIQAIMFNQQAAGGGGGGAGSGGGGGGGMTATPTPLGGGGSEGARGAPQGGRPPLPGQPGGREMSPGNYTVPPLSISQIGTSGFDTVPGPNNSPGGASGGGGAAAPAAGGGSSQGTSTTQYVRYLYKRGAGSSVNFVLNKFNKVVQIEVIGISNRSVKTINGITLGNSVSDVMKKYLDPDGYDIGGDYFMMRYLRQAKVAFRFTRENPTTPYRVTGIVVSAGKS